MEIGEIYRVTLDRDDGEVDPIDIELNIFFFFFFNPLLQPNFDKWMGRNLVLPICFSTSMVNFRKKFKYKIYIHPRYI